MTTKSGYTSPLFVAKEQTKRSFWHHLFFAIIEGRQHKANEFLKEYLERHAEDAAEQPHELDTGGQMQCELVHARARVRVRPCEIGVLMIAPRGA